MSVFSKTNQFVNKPNRNVFDLSYQNNLTMAFGGLYPVFCKEVIPGDSFSILPTFALKFMPMAFPVQTRMQANLHFFYVRNRNLWKDWQDFIGKTKDGLTMPYLINPDCSTGSLADYLGVPSTVVGEYGSVVSYTNTKDLGLGNYHTTLKIADYETSQALCDAVKGKKWIDLYSRDSSSSSTEFYACPFMIPLKGIDFLPKADGIVTLSWVQSNKSGITQPTDAKCCLIATPAGISAGENFTKIIAAVPVTVSANNSTKTYQLSFNGADFKSQMNENAALWQSNGSNEDGYNLYFIGSFISRSNVQAFSAEGVVNTTYVGSIGQTWSLPVDFEGVQDITAAGVPNPYKDGKIRLNALPFRAYESIYNGFYRNQQNDPFKINGKPEYNKYIPTNEGGADATSYKLYYRNWESDFLTSAMPSPQQGIAPLVGVSAAGTFTFQDADGQTYTAKCSVDKDGHTLSGIEVHSPDMPQGSLRALVDAISSGISINDFRNVNALQRWLEANMRRGFRYKDQLMTHFGVDASFEELDMPEFIGGCSEPILVNQISQTVETQDAPLGSYAGQASCIGTSNHSITKYCDEHGFIVGILSVSPVPNYSQLLPKMFLKTDTLDFFFPEFGHIGMQAISYKEVCPNQVYAADKQAVSDTLGDTFGYQRAWYEYLASVDEVHGDFRTSLRDFLVNRQFDEKPVLGEKFLKIDPEQINDVFTVTDVSDKILGQVYLKVTAKRPIPKFGIPRLE